MAVPSIDEDFAKCEKIDPILDQLIEKVIKLKKFDECIEFKVLAFLQKEKVEIDTNNFMTIIKFQNRLGLVMTCLMNIIKEFNATSLTNEQKTEITRMMEHIEEDRLKIEDIIGVEEGGA